MEFDNLNKLIENIGNTVKNEYQQKLKDGNHIASGKLYNSINYNIETTDTGIKLYFVALDYYIYIENGRAKGKMPPINEIRKWMVFKKIPDSGGTDYRIAKSIAKNGIKANPYLKNIKNKTIPTFKDDIEKALQLDIDIELQKIKDKHNDKHTS